MTKKKYTVHSMIKDYLIGIDDLDGNPMTYQDCCDILNKLTDENEQLKKENKELQQEIDDTWTKYENYHGMSIRNTEWY